MNTAQLALVPPLVISGTGYNVTLAAEASLLRDTLIKASQEEVSVVDSDESAAIAYNHTRALGSMRVTLRKTREMVTAPLTAKQKEIIALVDTFLDPLEREEKRLKSIQGEWVEQKAKQQEALLREAELVRMRAEEAEREAQRKREQEELARGKAETTEDPMAAAKASLIASKREQEAAEQEALEIKLKAEARSLDLQAEDATVRGGKMVLDCEVVDVYALASSNPRLVLITERRREIMEELQAQERRGLEPSLPGVRVFRRPKIGR